jgi:hypothetical protein
VEGIKNGCVRHRHYKNLHFNGFNRASACIVAGSGDGGKNLDKISPLRKNRLLLATTDTA